MVSSDEADPLFDGSDVATDTTRESDIDPDQEFEVEEIIAEQVEDGRLQYLIKWTGYAIADCTWEPESHLSDKRILQEWRDQKTRVIRGMKDSRGKSYRDVERFNLANIEMYETATTRAYEDRKLRRQKRRAKRISRGISVGPESDSEELDLQSEEADFDNKPSTAPTPKPPMTVPAPFIEESSDDKDDEDDQDDEDDEDDEDALLLSKRKRRPRSLSSEDLSSDSLMEELAQKSKSASRRDRFKRASNEVTKRAKPVFQASKVSDALTPAPARRRNSPIATPGEPPANAQSRRPSVPASKTPAAAQSSQAKKPAEDFRRPGTSALATMRPPSNVTAPALAARPPTNPSVETMKRTGAFKTGIKMNMSGTAPPKKERKQSTRPFKNLSHQNNAQKLARQEGIPDSEDLDFINDPNPSRRLSNGTVPIPPAAAPPYKPPASTPNPYSLRADGIAAHAHEQTGPTPRIPTVTFDDKYKEQVTCFDWKCGGCPRSDQDCKFLHRVVEFTSQDWDAVRKCQGEALTCYYWLNSEVGCRFPPNICKYAHWNTGLVASKGRGQLPTQVDKFALPKTGGAHKGMTCHFWFHQGNCKFSEKECSYAHQDTGVIAPGPLLEKRKHSGTTFPVSNTFNKQHTQAPEQNAQFSSSLHTHPPLQPPHQPEPAGFPMPKGSDGFEFTGATLSPFAPERAPAPQQSGQIPTLRDLANVSFAYPGANVSLPQINDNLELPEAIKVRLVLPASKEGSANEVDVQLLGLDPDLQNEVRSIIGNARLEITHHCTPVDWQKYCNEPPIIPHVTTGDVVLSSSSHGLDQYVRTLKCKGSLAGVIYHEQYTVIVYAAGQEVWNFLNGYAFKESPYAAIRKMRFHVRTPVTDFEPHSNKGLSPPVDVQTSLQSKLLLFPKQLFSWPWQHTKLDRNVFLFYGRDNREEMDSVTICLQGMGAVVYQNVTPGAWDYFRKHTDNGVVLFHPDFHEYWDMKGLRQLLFKKYNFFQIGCPVYEADVYDRKKELGIVGPNDVPSDVWQCIHLFPHGSLIMITDDLFVYQPIDTWKVVKAFLSTRLLRKLPEGATTHKLVARPNVIPWLHELVEAHEGKESREMHNARVNIWKAFRYELCPPMWVDTLYAPEEYIPNRLSQLISWPSCRVPRYYDLWKENETKATDGNVTLTFSEICCHEVANYRRFVVCHTWKKQAWLDERAHLYDVVTPADCIKFYIPPPT